MSETTATSDPFTFENNALFGGGLAVCFDEGAVALITPQVSLSVGRGNIGGDCSVDMNYAIPMGAPLRERRDDDRRARAKQDGDAAAYCGGLRYRQP